MKPIGIVSIRLFQKPTPERRFDVLMAGAGFNTGNLLFTNAVWNQIAGEKVHTGFHFDPAKANATLRALIIPAANWFNPHVDFYDLAERVEKLDIPVIMIGLGAQSDSYDTMPEVPEGTVRLMRAVAERSHSVSVRGHYTRKVLAKYGINNVTVTGCPSLYWDVSYAPAERLQAEALRNTGPTLLHSTRYSAIHEPFATTRSIHRKIFRLAFRSNTDLLLQSEPEEIGMITEASHKPELSEELKNLMVKIYDAKDWPRMEAFIKQHARVYFDPSHWSRAMQTYGRVFGTRLHATIMALNSGVPAVLVHHDSRTRELSEFAALPTFQPGLRRLDEKIVQKAIKNADFSAYASKRRANINIYSTFIRENGLEYSSTIDD